MTDDTTDNERLRALIDKWRVHAEVGNTEYANGVQDCFQECARELEQVIDDE